MPGFLNCPEASVFGIKFPNPEQFLSCWTSLPEWAKSGLVSLMLSEGVPAAYLSNPLIFDQVRRGLGSRLNIDPKQVTIVGSLRLGYSLGPPPRWGKPSSASSDLDLAAISHQLFDELCEAFNNWSAKVKATGIPEGRSYRYWSENLRLLPDNISKGFIDPHFLPDDYRPARRITDALKWLKFTLGSTPEQTPPKEVSLRVYRDWDAFIRRVVLNLNWATSTPMETHKAK